MVFLYSIFCQWFSRGCLLKCCLEQEEWQILLVVFFIGFAVGSPIQGYMSGKSFRKKILLLTIPSVLPSILAVIIGTPLCSKEQFSILLGDPCILNGVFGNVFLVAAAAYSERISDFRKATNLSFASRYGGLFLPFLLQLPNFYGLLTALIINWVAIMLIGIGFNDNKLVKERLISS